jgi:hypothetical protein
MCQVGEGFQLVNGLAASIHAGPEAIRHLAEKIIQGREKPSQARKIFFKGLES